MSHLEAIGEFLAIAALFVFFGAAYCIVDPQQPTQKGKKHVVYTQSISR